MQLSKEEIIQELRSDLLLFGVTVSPQTFYKPSPPFHYEVADYLMNKDIRQLCIQAPRGFAKSSLAVMFILHHITFGEGDKFVVIQSKTAGEAINRLAKIKEVLSSPPYWDIVGERVYEKTALMWRENKIKTYINGNKVTIKAIGTGMQVRGALESDTRITLYLLDDPEDELNTKTEEAMVSNFRVFLGGLPGLDSRNGRVVVIGTPVHELCIIERLRTMKNWTYKWYEACDDKFENLLWADYRSAEWLRNEHDALASAGQRRMFYSEYRCTLIPGEDQLFKEEDFRYHNGEFEIKNGDTFLKIDGELKPINVFLGIDPASSVKQSADYSVIMPVGFDENKNIYVLDYFRQRVNPLVLTEAIIDFIKRFNPVRGHIESTGFQEMLRQTVRQRLKDENIHLSGLEVKFNPRTEKSARLETLQPFFAQHRVFLKESMKDLINELLMYPRGKHDDMIDGLYYATRKLVTPDHTLENAEYDGDTQLVIDRGGKLKELGWRAA